jgi:hypothetical protein
VIGLETLQIQGIEISTGGSTESNIRTILGNNNNCNKTREVGIIGALKSENCKFENCHFTVTAAKENK